MQGLESRDKCHVTICSSKELLGYDLVTSVHEKGTKVHSQQVNVK